MAMVEQNSERFQTLHVVRQSKPQMLEEELGLHEPQFRMAPDVTSLAQVDPMSLHDVSSKLSGAFKTLVEQLIQQHTREIGALQARLEPFLMEQKIQAARAQETGSATGCANSAEQASESMVKPPISPTSSSTNEVLRSKSSNASRKRGKRSEHRHVHASELIDILEHQDSKQMFESDSEKSDPFSDVAKSEDDTLTRAHSSPLEHLQYSLQSTWFEGVITSLLLVNVLWMGLELQIGGSKVAYEIGISPSPLLSPETYQIMETCFNVGDILFTAIFAIDVLVRIIVLGLGFWKVCMNYVDLGVTITSLAEVFMYSGIAVNPVLFRLLRIGKLARAFRMVTMSSVLSSLQLLIKCLTASVDMLFWTFCLLTFLQCIAGMVVSTLCREFVANENVDLQLRQEVFRYYGTFSRTTLTMFEILFANWAPAARVLVENISEWFSVFFLLYRCVLGFAVLNVVSAVFVQQTMKTASSDEELAFKQKQRDVAVYTRKVKKVFQTMDKSGDGALNMEEFAKLVKSPMLKFWMSQLELEYHDLMSLFEFLDNGDGEITLTEFIEGAGRLRGNAKALDVWRLETKVEVLFEEVVSMLRKQGHGDSDNDSETGSVVQDVFAGSKFKHIMPATGLRMNTT
mmetsp:Transcript_20327/g.47432  ORF Transcript_20327/g.47432 Transcript_20327/m.47432 type:complete len:629 (-) Transcript_20327:165-2051(-)